MTMHDHLLPAKAARHIGSSSRLLDLGFSLATKIAGWITTAVDYYTTAKVYEQLSGLSDAELHRRGLSRATLGWHIAQACDRDSA
jgi:hypothetical protein